MSHIRGQTRHGRKNEGHTRLEHETWESWVTVRRPRLAEADREDPGIVGRISGSSGATRNKGLRMPGPSDWARRWASRNAGCFRCLDWNKINGGSQHHSGQFFPYCSALIEFFVSWENDHSSTIERAREQLYLTMHETQMSAFFSKTVTIQRWDKQLHFQGRRLSFFTTLLEMLKTFHKCFKKSH